MNNCMLVDTSKFVVVVKANQPSVFGAKGYISYLLQGKDGVRSEYGIDEDALFIRDDGPRLPLEPIKVVADGHGESEQLFERLLWLLKSDGDAARLKGHTRGEILELLRQDLKRGLDKKLWLCEAIFLQPGQNFRYVPAAFPFIVPVVALGEVAEMGDEGIPVGQAVGADTLGDTGSEDLLGASAADAEEEFYRRAIDERARKGLEARGGCR
jgi:hypothetical protein